MSESGGVKTWWADLLIADELDEYEYTVGNLMKEHPRQGPLDWQSRLFQVVPKSDFDKLLSENQGLREKLDKIVNALDEWYGKENPRWSYFDWCHWNDIKEEALQSGGDESPSKV